MGGWVRIDTRAFAYGSTHQFCEHGQGYEGMSEGRRRTEPPHPTQGRELGQTANAREDGLRSSTFLKCRPAQANRHRPNRGVSAKRPNPWLRLCGSNAGGPADRPRGSGHATLPGAPLKYRPSPGESAPDRSGNERKKAEPPEFRFPRQPGGPAKTAAVNPVHESNENKFTRGSRGLVGPRSDDLPRFF